MFDEENRTLQINGQRASFSLASTTEKANVTTRVKILMKVIVDIWFFDSSQVVSMNLCPFKS